MQTLIDELKEHIIKAVDETGKSYLFKSNEFKVSNGDASGIHYLLYEENAPTPFGSPAFEKYMEEVAGVYNELEAKIETFAKARNWIQFPDYPEDRPSLNYATGNGCMFKFYLADMSLHIIAFYTGQF